jgi:GTPase SAR1 family protein
VYDVTQKDTFANLETWLNEADQFSTGVGKEAVKLLVGNKVDLPRVVERSEAEAWAKERNMLFIEASAKTTEGITQVFNEAVQKVCLLIFNDDDDDDDDDDDIIMKIMKGYVDNEVVDKDGDNNGD